MSVIQNIIKFSKVNNIYNLPTQTQNLLFFVPVRGSKHWNPKFKWLRSKKVIPVNLKDDPLNSRKNPESKEKWRSYLKQLGVMPTPHWNNRPITVTSAIEVMEPYEPPKGDGKESYLSKGSKGLIDNISQKNKTRSSVNKIKSYENDFSKNVFVQHAHDIYVKAHTLLMNKDPEELSEYVTERGIGEMLEGVKNRTIRWKFIKSLEPPAFIQARVAPVVAENNLFAQITVRFHTQQSLAIYDRFGRLIYGSEILAKDVLEYAVFEKHINNVYGTWKLHTKIIPEGVDSSEPSARTYRISNEKPEDPIYEDEDDEDDLVIKRA